MFATTKDGGERNRGPMMFSKVVLREAILCYSSDCQVRGSTICLPKGLITNNCACALITSSTFKFLHSNSYIQIPNRLLG